jgi:hypothetical protein
VKEHQFPGDGPSWNFNPPARIEHRFHIDCQLPGHISKKIQQARRSKELLLENIFYSLENSNKSHGCECVNNLACSADNALATRFID